MTARLPRPCSPTDALARLDSIVGIAVPYYLGTGDFDPASPNMPWSTRKDGKKGSDCRVACCFAYEIPAHRRGYNGDYADQTGKIVHAPWATVSDDVNYNSLIEDAEHEQDLCVIVADDLQVGDILCYPTIQLRTHDASGVEGDWLRNPDGSIKTWIGHGMMLAQVPPIGWTRASGWSALQVLQCHGPDGRTPAVVATDAHALDIHDATWPLPQHCTKVVRMKP